MVLPSATVKSACPSSCPRPSARPPACRSGCSAPCRSTARRSCRSSTLRLAIGTGARSSLYSGLRSMRAVSTELDAAVGVFDLRGGMSSGIGCPNRRRESAAAVLRCSSSRAVVVEGRRLAGMRDRQCGWTPVGLGQRRAGVEPSRARSVEAPPQRGSSSALPALPDPGIRASAEKIEQHPLGPHEARCGRRSGRIPMTSRVHRLEQELAKLEPQRDRAGSPGRRCRSSVM